MVRKSIPKHLPFFNLHEYRKILRLFRSAGYTLCPVSSMRHRKNEKRVFLRHDVDFSPLLACEMAKTEQEENCSATYYFLLTGKYNLFECSNKSALRSIKDFGHEIGLHYDLVDYPSSKPKAIKHLNFEISLLSKLAKCPVRSICMHQPSLSTVDYFKEGSDYIHPHSLRYAKGLVYISDSCRAWRDEKLVEFYSKNGPSKLLLNIHPELWINGNIKKRMDYLKRVLFSFEVKKIHDFYLKDVKKIWMTHSGARADEARSHSLHG